MRKIAVLLIAFILFLTACGTDSVGDVSSEPSAPPSAESEQSVPDTTTSRTTETSMLSTTKRRPTTTKRRPTTAATTTTTTAPTLGEFEQSKKMLIGEEGKNNVIYQFGENGLIVRETTIDSGRGGDPVEIVHITDAHVAFEITRRLNWQTCLRYAAGFDYTVATGDLIDGLHTDLTKWFKDSLVNNPNTMLTLGNHEWNPTKGTPEQMSDRYALLQEYWPNNVVYSSVVVKNKVMLIQLDNSQNEFCTEQIAKLQADLTIARDKGYTVLLFYHVPLCTKNPAETGVKALLPFDPTQIHKYNFSRGHLCGTADDATGQVYDIITNNADVIKGAFCGHLHEDIYTEIVAKTPDGKDAVIPQYINHAARYDNGHVLKITVK